MMSNINLEIKRLSVVVQRIEQLLKHLQGEHDQRDHGRGVSAGRDVNSNGSPGEVRLRMDVSRYNSFEDFTDPALRNATGNRWKRAAASANAILKHQKEKPQDFELRTLSVKDVKPSQTGEDYVNDSSKQTAKKLKEFSKHKDDAPDSDELRFFLEGQRMENINPIAVDSNLKIIDGNHRHAAHEINKEKFIVAMVAVGPGSGKIRNLRETFDALRK